MERSGGVEAAVVAAVAGGGCNVVEGGGNAESEVAAGASRRGGRAVVEGVANAISTEGVSDSASRCPWLTPVSGARAAEGAGTGSRMSARGAAPTGSPRDREPRSRADAIE